MIAETFPNGYRLLISLKGKMGGQVNSQINQLHKYNNNCLREICLLNT